MDPKFRALKNWFLHSTEDRIFRWAWLVLAATGLLLAIVYKPSPIYILDGSLCRPFGELRVICPNPSPAPL